ncbi:hypothetical protein CBL_00761 [Carabus blaptoides fortunei]
MKTITHDHQSSHQHNSARPARIPCTHRQYRESIGRQQVFLTLRALVQQQRCTYVAGEGAREMTPETLIQIPDVRRLELGLVTTSPEMVRSDGDLESSPGTS